MSKLRDVAKEVSQQGTRKGLGICWLVGVFMLLAAIVIAVSKGATGALVFFPMGLFVLLLCLANSLDRARKNQPLLIIEEGAERFERESIISGSDHGNFLVALEKAYRNNLITPDQKKQIMKALYTLILEKSFRISGLDYVELEKKLTMAATDDGDNLFSAGRVKTILIDYERLRDEIRDRRLGESNV